MALADPIADPKPGRLTVNYWSLNDLVSDINLAESIGGDCEC